MLNGEEFKRFELSEEDKLRMGLKKRPEEPPTILVAIPKRYNNHSVMYETEWVNEKTLNLYVKKYPSVEIVRRKRRK